MLEPPAFSSIDDYRSRLDDVGFWSPHVAAILQRVGRTDVEQEPFPGYNATWPTFLCGDVVVKLFGYLDGWRRTFEAERGALALVSTDPEIAAPRVVGEGHLHEAWPYVVTARVPGAAAFPSRPPAQQWPTIAAELGRLVRRIHALSPVGVGSDADWPAANPVTAAARSSLPPHLVAQVEDYIAGLPPFDDVFVHGDLVAQHVFVQVGHVTGIIDWADAMVTDRHYELAQLFRDTFECDKTLLRIFLDASDWPVGSDFPRLVMGHALRRQVFMLAQHPSGDVFMPIAEKFPLNDIATFDELALELFAV